MNQPVFQKKKSGRVFFFFRDSPVNFENRKAVMDCQAEMTALQRILCLLDVPW